MTSPASLPTAASDATAATPERDRRALYAMGALFVLLFGFYFRCCARW